MPVPVDSCCKRERAVRLWPGSVRSQCPLAPLYIGTFADGDLAGPAESLQFLPLRGGDEQGFPGQGADLRRRHGAEGPAGCEVKGSLAVLG